MNWVDNSRHLKGWHRLLWVCLGSTRTARRLIGGRWENWWTDVVNSAIWYPVEQPGTYMNRPAPICRPEFGIHVEEWPHRG